MNETKRLLYEHYREAEQRLDYFVLGGTGAMCGYVGQTLTPQPISISPYGLEISSLVLLLFSLIFGFLRVEQVSFSQSLNYKLAEARENHPSNIKRIVEKMDKISSRAARSYRLRNGFLIAGLYGLILSKVLTPYFH